MKIVKIGMGLLCWALVANIALAQEKGVAALLDSAYRMRLHADVGANFRLLTEAEHLEEAKKKPVLRAKLYGELSKHYLVNTDYDQAKSYADSNLSLALESGIPLAQAYGHVALATYYNFLGVGDLAVDHAKKTLNILRNEQDPALAARANYILYGVYSGWDDLELSNKYAQLAISEALSASDHEMLANAYSAYSVVMELQYEHAEDRHYLDSMRHYLQQSIDVYKKQPDWVGRRTYAIANINMANYFFRYGARAEASTQDSIVKYAEIARQVYQPFDKSYEIMGNVNGLLAEVASMRGADERAESFLMESYIQLTSVETPSYYTLSNVAQGLSDFHARRGNHKQALSYQKKKEEFNQKIFNEAEMFNAKQLEAQFENKKLMEDIDAAEQKAKSRRLQSFLLGGICLLLLVSLFLLRTSFKSKSKLQVEEQGRLKAEQELLQLQKEQMQKEAMADALQIERKNRLLQQLKNRFRQRETNNNAGYIDNIIKEEMRLEERVENSAKAFEHINPEFFNRLKEHSGGKLTPLEMKHCAYIHLQLDTKEIAAAFHITPKSVRVSKYRIKQKLRLGKSIDLDRFLHELV